MDWLHTNVDGFLDRRHARKYAALMLKVSIIIYMEIHVHVHSTLALRK